jgi:hypothetical protein
MKQDVQIALFALAFVPGIFAQSDIPMFKVDARSAFVWGEDASEGARSSTILDPRTGNSIHRLSYAGIEVSSQIGYERVSSSEAGKLLNYTTTIANNTGADLSVRYGGASVDGHAALPLLLAPTNKEVSKRSRKDVWVLNKMYCFNTGFGSTENFFSANAPTRVFTVRAKTAMTVSSVTMYPTSSPSLCSVDGCHITGTIRYYIQVNNRDYVFVWPGRAVIYCGE